MTSRYNNDIDNDNSAASPFASPDSLFGGSVPRRGPSTNMSVPLFPTSQTTLSGDVSTLFGAEASVTTPGSLPASAMDTLFYNGTPASSNNDNLYIQISSTENEGGVSGGSEFWVTVPWSTVSNKLFQHREVILEIVAQVNKQPHLRQRALAILSRNQAEAIQTPGSGTFSDIFMGPGDFNLPTSPSVTGAGTGNSSSDDSTLFSPATAVSFWNSSPDMTRNPLFANAPDTPPTPAMVDFRQHPTSGSPSITDSLKPWDLSPSQLKSFGIASGTTNTQFQIPTPAQHRQSNSPAVAALPPSYSRPSFTPHRSRTPPSNTSSANTETPGIMTAQDYTIDPFLLADPTIQSNTVLVEFVWSPNDTTLYGINSPQGRQTVNEEGAIRMCFPPGTMIMANEKDGTLATPAYSAAHPHSNEWLKAQVCHHRCPYRAGTASLKRPKTVREHFRKCVYLDEHHPLKVLSALQLAVLERESQGLLPNRRRTRAARLQSINSVY